MRTIYCDNCDSEATHAVLRPGDDPFYLCFTCKTAYEFGQNYPERQIVGIEEVEQEDDEE